MFAAIHDSLAHLPGRPFPEDVPDARWRTLAADAAGPAFAPPTRGTVYGVLLNHADALAALGASVHAPPYKAPPQAPVLYIKPRNTLAGHRESVVVPDGVAELEVGATLGVVIGAPACRLAPADALAAVAGYTVVNDLGIAHGSYYRPALRFKCRDGFCPIGPAIVARRRVADPDALQIAVAIDGKVVQRSGTSGLVRPVARLLADVTEFMTLSPGDVLLVGVAATPPRARAGQRVSIAIEHVGELHTPLVATPPTR